MSIIPSSFLLTLNDFKAKNFLDFIKNITISDCRLYYIDLHCLFFPLVQFCVFSPMPSKYFSINALFNTHLPHLLLVWKFKAPWLLHEHAQLFPDFHFQGHDCSKFPVPKLQLLHIWQNLSHSNKSLKHLGLHNQYTLNVSLCLYYKSQQDLHLALSFSQESRNHPWLNIYVK